MNKTPEEQEREKAADKYITDMRISSASIDPNRDRHRRVGFVAGWNKHAAQFESAGLREALQDLVERVERARNILQTSSEGGNWGMLDTENARKALAKEERGKEEGK